MRMLKIIVLIFLEIFLFLVIFAPMNIESSKMGQLSALNSKSPSAQTLNDIEIERERLKKEDVIIRVIVGSLFLANTFFLKKVWNKKPV